MIHDSKSRSNLVNRIYESKGMLTLLKPHIFLSKRNVRWFVMTSKDDAYNMRALEFRDRIGHARAKS